jgi:ESCRT-II complex subunit VPS25
MKSSEAIVRFFDFPPFFTKQPNQDTWNKQQELWMELILSFCRSKRLYVLPVDNQIEPFSNPKISSRFLSENLDLFCFSRTIK